MKAYSLELLKSVDRISNFDINVLQHVTNVNKLDILMRNAITYKQNKKFQNNKNHPREILMTVEELSKILNGEMVSTNQFNIGTT